MIPTYLVLKSSYDRKSHFQLRFNYFRFVCLCNMIMIVKIKCFYNIFSTAAWCDCKYDGYRFPTYGNEYIFSRSGGVELRYLAVSCSGKTQRTKRFNTGISLLILALILSETVSTYHTYFHNI